MLWTPKVEPSFSAPEDIPRSVWDILRGRGILEPQKARQFLAPSLKDIRDPFSLRQMDRAVRRLVEARRNQEIVGIYGDFDLDGTSGLTLLEDALSSMGFEHVVTAQPKRLSDGYGLHPHLLESLKAQGVAVVITVDVGITGFEGAKKAKNIGMDLIITDHHLPSEELPDAFCVINPNRKDCSSSLGHLSGTGVAFFLVLALKRGLVDAGIDVSFFNPKKLLDCFVIGTLTDMVPLKEENRILAKHGLIELGRTQRPGLEHLIRSLDLVSDQLGSQEVVITIAPKLNALSRMEEGLMPLSVMTERDATTAEKMISEVMRAQKRRKSLQAFAEGEVKGLALQQAMDDNVVFAFSEEFHKGVLGLVATQVMLKHQVPAFIGNVFEGKISGSIRAPDLLSVNLVDVIEGAGDLLTHGGGHAKAAGFGLKLEDAPRFHDYLKSVFQAIHLGDSAPSRVYDAELRLSEFGPHFLNWYRQLEPFGTDFPVPLFRIKNVSVGALKELRGGHLRLDLVEGPHTQQAIWFGPPPGLILLPGQPIEVLAELNWNHFRGVARPQWLIRDIKTLG